MKNHKLSHPSSKVPVTRGANPPAAFQDRINKFFSDFFSVVALEAWLGSKESPFCNYYPAVDVTENGKEFKITAELPGLESKDVQINATEGYVTIKGEKKAAKKEELKGYFRQECSYGSFQRVVALPATANIDKAEARFKNGVLSLVLPKKAGAQSKTRKIEIKQAA